MSGKNFFEWINISVTKLRKAWRENAEIELSVGALGCMFAPLLHYPGITLSTISLILLFHGFYRTQAKKDAGP